MIFFSLLRLIRLFSIDIIAGALASLVFSSAVMGVRLPGSYYTVLALSVWLIYTMDHLMDGVKTRGKSLSEARNFFFNYKIPIILVFILVLVFTFRLIVYRLDEKIVEFGFAPGMTVVAYLLMNRYYGNGPKWFFIKELWIAIIYTLAIWGGSVIYAGDTVNPAQFMMMLSFGLIIFGNVLIYSIYERDSDIHDKNRSFVSDFGIKAAVNTAVFSLSVSILIALSANLFLGMNLIYITPPVLIASLMLLIISYPKIFSINKTYGFIADVSLLLFLLTLCS